MATRFKIELEDGTEMTVKVKPKHILKMERAGNDAASAENTYMLAWYASGTDLSFDDWMDIVEEIDPILDETFEDVDVPPTTSGSRGSRSTRV